MTGLTAIDLSAGCGGLSLALARSGFSTTLAVEEDPHAAETFRLNFPTTTLVSGPVAALSSEQLRHGATLVAATPSCRRGESMLSGSPGAEELAHLCRIVRDVRPSAVLLDLDGRGTTGGPPPSALLVLEELGFQVSWKLLRATDYGSWVAKTRLVAVGLRSPRPFEWDPPTHGETTGLVTPVRAADRMPSTRKEESGPDPWVLLHDLPESFRWCGPRHEQGRQVGAATSVELATSIGRALRRHLEHGGS